MMRRDQMQYELLHVRVEFLEFRLSLDITQ